MRRKLTAFLLCLFLFHPITIYGSDDLILGGDSIGIQLSYDGVMISGTYPFTVNAIEYNPSDTIHTNDIIQQVNGVRIHSIEELYTQINTFQDAVNEVPITLLRDNKTINLTLTTVYDKTTNAYKSGLYIKDKIVGVGTMTYYDPLSNTYGALGHEIYDGEKKEIAEVFKGSLYSAYVDSIQKAVPNVPGEKHASIDYQNVIGDVQVNSNIGIYGNYDVLPSVITKLPWAKQEEINVGLAYMYTVLHGDKVEAFKIDITKLHAQADSDVKGIEFKVVDEKLKQSSNGIVQGMSGSPIVQNGRIIGCVTHVVTENPVHGYGVYIEWMLKQSRNL